MSSLQKLFDSNQEREKYFPPLEELFGENKEIINKIITTFIKDTNSRIVLLENAVVENDFEQCNYYVTRCYLCLYKWK